jgi:predicted heme/steroid binding protein
LGNAEREFTPEQLEQYDGKEGRPAYIAYKGKVYDVTDNYLWTNGNHQGNT